MLTANDEASSEDPLKLLASMVENLNADQDVQDLMLIKSALTKTAQTRAQVLQGKSAQIAGLSFLTLIFRVRFARPRTESH